MTIGEILIEIKEMEQIEDIYQDYLFNHSNKINKCRWIK